MDKSLRKAVIAGNWKMNKTPDEAKAIINEMKPLVADADCDVVLCVPYIDIFAAQLTQTRQQITLLEGSQSEADQAVAVITDQMNALRTDSAALEAERSTASGHITDLRILQAAAEEDKNKKKVGLRERSRERENVKTLKCT